MVETKLVRFHCALIFSRKINMLSIPGIAAVTLLYESANSLVYRAIREADNQPIILKLLKESYPTPQELVRYRTEYRITRELKEAGEERAFGLEKKQKNLRALF